MSDSKALDDRSAPYPPQAYAWYVIAVLFIATLLSQLDRQLPAVLVKPLRHEFGISDTGFSFLQGYAFALFYTFAGLPLGWLVDRTVRRNLIIVGMLVWSAMTVFSAFAQDYHQMVVARMGVGIGEAVLAPAAYSMIADYVAPHRRGRALSVYYVALAIGSGVSLILGGLILRLTPATGLVLPAIGPLAQWRLAFLAAGAPGVLLAFLLLTIREPVRRGVGVTVEKSSLKEFGAYLWTHASTFSRVLTFPAVIAIIGYGALAWAPALYDRKFGIPASASVVKIGLLVAVGGLIGSLVSGYLSDRWAAKGVLSARYRVTLVSWILLLPTAAAWPLVNNPDLSLVLLAISVTGAGMAQATAPAVVQESIPNRMRGRAIAVYLLLGGLVGIGGGPLIIALVSDHIYHGDKAALAAALATVNAPMAILGLWLTWSGLKPYARTLATLRAAEAA
jgi:MFS family permease